MTLTELTAEVYTLTARPDLVAETLTAIKAGTLKTHQSDYYYKDVYEVGVAFNTSDFVQNLDYRALLPRWRALKYLRKYDNVLGVPGRELDIILPDNLFDNYKTTKQDICYVAGSFVQINSATAEQFYLLGCYLNPDITTATYTSWVALDHPYAIVFDAAATVFKAIGKDDEASAYRGLMTEQLAMLKTSNILAVGY